MNIFFKVIGIAIVFISFGCVQKSSTPLNANQQAIADVKATLQDGDLVLRLEDDFISRLLADLSPKEKKYSHAGIVKKAGDNIGIYNIMPSSMANMTDDTIKLSPIDSFVNPKKHELVAVYRYAISDAEKKTFIENIENYRKQNVKFDLKFNYASDNEMYCSELIAKALEKATNEKIKIEKVFIDKTRILGVKRFFKFMNDSVDLSKYPVITLDNLYLNPFSKLVYSYKFDPALRNPTKAN